MIANYNNYPPDCTMQLIESSIVCEMVNVCTLLGMCVCVCVRVHYWVCVCVCMCAGCVNELLITTMNVCFI